MLPWQNYSTIKYRIAENLNHINKKNVMYSLTCKY